MSTQDEQDLDLSEERRSELIETFNMFDKDGDGAISAAELASILKALGQKPTEDELQIMMSSADTDNNGVIDLNEYMALMQDHFMEESQLPHHEDELKDTFKLFDINGDGFINEEELKQALLKLGERSTGEQIKQMIVEADKDGNGLIDYAEFCAMVGKRE